MEFIINNDQKIFFCTSEEQEKFSFHNDISIQSFIEKYGIDNNVIEKIIKEVEEKYSINKSDKIKLKNKYFKVNYKVRKFGFNSFKVNLDLEKSNKN